METTAEAAETGTSTRTRDCAAPPHRHRRPDGQDNYTISEVVAFTGLTAHTLRWYERIGLMPHIDRSHTGQRRYSNRDLDWLDLVGKLRLTGMPVADMVRYAELVREGTRPTSRASSSWRRPAATSRRGSPSSRTPWRFSTTRSVSTRTPGVPWRRRGPDDGQQDRERGAGHRRPRGRRTGPRLHGHERRVRAHGRRRGPGHPGTGAGTGRHALRHGRRVRPGENEKFISPFVRAHRDEVVLATKFGIFRDPADPTKRTIRNDTPYIRRAVEGACGGWTSRSSTSTTCTAVT